MFALSGRNIRIVGSIAAAVGVALFLAMAWQATRAGADGLINFAHGLAFLLLGVATCVGLHVLARLAEEKDNWTASIVQHLAKLQTHLDQLSTSIGAPRPAGDEATPITSPDSTTIQRIDETLEEIRQFTLMSEAEREQRLRKVVEERKRQLARDVMELIGKQEWARAEHLLVTLETHFPNDPYTMGCRRDMEDRRKEAEASTIAAATKRAENLISSESFDNAFMTANRLVENFPNNPQARELLNRITRDRDLYVETNAQKLYEEIRNSLENRSWRSALTGSMKMIARFPTHIRALQIRDQLSTIQDNAEIEERQSIEVQIEELVRNREIPKAIALGEDLIRRFPFSPQAEQLQKYLPSLREMTVETAQQA